jgi:hypothetical protein
MHSSHSTQSMKEDPLFLRHYSFTHRSRRPPIVIPFKYTNSSYLPVISFIVYMYSYKFFSRVPNPCSDMAEPCVSPKVLGSPGHVAPEHGASALSVSRTLHCLAPERHGYLSYICFQGSWICANNDIQDIQCMPSRAQLESGRGKLSSNIGPGVVRHTAHRVLLIDRIMDF